MKEPKYCLGEPACKGHQPIDHHPDCPLARPTPSAGDPIVAYGYVCLNHDVPEPAYARPGPGSCVLWCPKCGPLLVQRSAIFHDEDAARAYAYGPDRMPAEFGERVERKLKGSA